MNTPTPITIVTAASANHYEPLVNLCWCLSKLEPNSKVIIWDLGLTPEQVKTLNELPPFALKDFTIRSFDFSKYPPHFNMANNAGAYAWKPVVIADAMSEFGGLVLWLDAGTVVLEPLWGIRKVLMEVGFYCPRIGVKIGDRTHHDTINKLTAQAVTGCNMLDAAAVGFNASFGAPVMNLANRWKELAMDPAVIYPPGASKATHACDESILSILAYQAGIQVVSRWLGIRAHQDWMSLRETKFQLTGKMQ